MRKMMAVLTVAAAVAAAAGCNMISGADRLASDLLERARIAVEAAEAAEAEETAQEAAQGAEEDAGAVVAPAEAPTGQEGGASAAEAASGTPAESAATVPALQWCWGGFNGGKAKEVAGAQIKGLKVSGSGMSYKWATGGCEQLGASSKTAADCLACLFLEDGRGGKFDWISTSRTSRSFENIETGYNGWDAAAFKKSKKVFFCIVSKDGKKRTNIIEAAK